MPACCHAPAANAAVDTPWMMLFTMVPLMVAFHCAGMCGPLILSFRFGLDQTSRGKRLTAASGHLLAYQCGRAVLYAAFGAAIGGIGQMLSSSIATFNRYAVLAIAAAFLLWGLQRFGAFGRLRPGRGDAGGLGLAGRMLKMLREKGPKQPWLFALMLGMVMAFLPCGLTMMVLGQAAITASAWQGAAMMVILVMMTTPVLLGFAILPAAVQRFRVRAGSWLEPALICFGGIWIGLHGLAMNGVIPHAKWMLEIAGTTVPLMFW